MEMEFRVVRDMGAITTRAFFWIKASYIPHSIVNFVTKNEQQLGPMAPTSSASFSKLS